MPNNLVKTYARETHKTVAAVEKIWDEAKAAAAKKFKKGPRFWAYVNGTVMKRLGIAESAITFKEYMDLEFNAATPGPEVPASVAADVTNTPQGSAQAQPAPNENENFARYLGCLFAARDKAHMLHLATKSFAEHKALNELYDALLDHADKMAESYQGKHGIVDLCIPAASDIFGQSDAKSFIYALSGWLESCARALLGDDDYIINQFEELVGVVYQKKYLIDNLS